MNPSVAEVVFQHLMADADSCGCNEMFYDCRLSPEQINMEHSLHVEERLYSAGFGELSEAQARAYDKGYGHGKYDQKYHPAMSLSGTPRPEKSRRNPYRRPQ